MAIILSLLFGASNDLMPPSFRSRISPTVRAASRGIVHSLPRYEFCCFLRCHRGDSMHLLHPPLGLWYISFFTLVGPGYPPEIAVQNFRWSTEPRTCLSILVPFLTPCRILLLPYISTLVGISADSSSPRNAGHVSPKTAAGVVRKKASTFGVVF